MRIRNSGGFFQKKQWWVNDWYQHQSWPFFWMLPCWGCPKNAMIVIDWGHPFLNLPYWLGGRSKVCMVYPLPRMRQPPISPCPPDIGWWQFNPFHFGEKYNCHKQTDKWLDLLTHWNIGSCSIICKQQENGPTKTSMDATSNTKHPS